ncbi:YrdB family protein [Blastococcus sp. VKM Ac-2987]|uniref:YrdB family protein n=1 Tax=Blastococcus sp. VKM Ac-2987 TaxID=3004141 RepID=UPI0022AB7689|nr:YrdB family protein [Blastococcus sp. VKM Ac-2987]MCZ2860833.1 YrdB family protein [Blastococcus sp. VKM Ac-2987]
MVLSALQGANLAARFALELSALGALAYWGFQVSTSPGVRVLAGLGAPVVAAVAWGLFASPRAAVQLPAPAQLAVQLAVLAGAVAALVAVGRPQLAGAFGAAAVTNAALMAWWDQ